MKSFVVIVFCCCRLRLTHSTPIHVTFSLSSSFLASPLFLGVFDKDILGDHDPVGRIVINLTNFQDHTVYLLNYSLHNNPNQNDNRGTITVRLRVEWTDKNEKMKRTLENPPRKIFLNVSSLKGFRLVRYLCRGDVDMEQASMDSVRQYMSEFYMHLDNLFYLADDILRILLWRGKIQVSLPKPRFVRRNNKQMMIQESQQKQQKDEQEDNRIQVHLWFPFRSMVLFQTVITAIEKPRLIPGLTFFYIGIVLLKMMVSRYHHPNPWKRCKVSSLNKCEYCIYIHTCVVQSRRKDKHKMCISILKHLYFSVHPSHDYFFFWNVSLFFVTI
jgi:hypothetical protein